MRVAGVGLQDLANPVNVYGLNNMDLNRPEERTLLQDHPVRVTSESSGMLRHVLKPNLHKI